MIIVMVAFVGGVMTKKMICGTCGCSASSCPFRTRRKLMKLENKMKKVMLLMGLMLVAFNTFAGICAKGSLSGSYNYNLSRVENNVARIDFNGTGLFTISGIQSEAGVVIIYGGNGTYIVSTGCIATLTFTLTTGSNGTIYIFLDEMDNVPATRLAYHGNLVYKSVQGTSGSGTIDRVIGKFQ
jgi:hypothetical protein